MPQISLGSRSRSWWVMHVRRWLSRTQTFSWILMQPLLPSYIDMCMYMYMYMYM